MQFAKDEDDATRSRIALLSRDSSSAKTTGPLRPSMLQQTRKVPPQAWKLVLVEPVPDSPAVSPVTYDTRQAEELHALPGGDPADSFAMSDILSTGSSVKSDELKDSPFKLSEEQLLWWERNSVRRPQKPHHVKPAPIPHEDERTTTRVGWDENSSLLICFGHYQHRHTIHDCMSGITAMQSIGLELREAARRQEDVCPRHILSCPVLALQRTTVAHSSK